MIDLTKLVKPLEWETTYFVVHAAGSFDFFINEWDAERLAYELGRSHYTYNEKALAAYGDRLRKDKEEWETQTKASHIRSTLAALEAVKAQVRAEERAKYAALTATGLRVVLITCDPVGDIENGTLELSDEPTVILQGPLASIRAAGGMFGQSVAILAAIQEDKP